MEVIEKRTKEAEQGDEHHGESSVVFAPSASTTCRNNLLLIRLIEGMAAPLRLRTLGILSGAAFLVACVNLRIGALVIRRDDAPTSASGNHHVQHLAESSRRTLLNSELGDAVDDRNLEPIPRPPLDSIVQGWNITGDPSWLLQFSIVGFPKSGTSTLMFHLREHPEIHMFKDERCELAYNQQVRLIEDIYRQFPRATTEDGRFVRGIKCPLDLENPQLSMKNYRTFFPKTDFIVGIRHPVLWFESFYNFRIHNKFDMPPAETLIGKCRRQFANVCTFRGNFHVFLSNLGKTNMIVDDNERKLVDPEFWTALNPVPTPRRVFLYEVSQLSDRDEQRSLQFRTDLQHYLRLTEPIEPFIWFKPGINHTEERALEEVNFKKIDICEDRYSELRSVLMHQSVQAAQWIRTYFMHADGVVVSSPDYLSNTLLKAWEIDPCIERRQRRRKD